MAIKVRIPTPLQKITQGKSEVDASGKTVLDVITDLERLYPGVMDRICDDNKKVRKFVNIFVNEEDVRFLQNELTSVKDGDELSIIPAIAGGSLKTEPQRSKESAESAEKL